MPGRLCILPQSHSVFSCFQMTLSRVPSLANGESASLETVYALTQDESYPQRRTEWHCLQLLVLEWPLTVAIVAVITALPYSLLALLAPLRFSVAILHSVSTVLPKFSVLSIVLVVWNFVLLALVAALPRLYLCFAFASSGSSSFSRAHRGFSYYNMTPSFSPLHSHSYLSPPPPKFSLVIHAL